MDFPKSLATKRYLVLSGLVIILLQNACKESKVKSDDSQVIETTSRLFTSVTSDKSGINFTNKLEETLESNYYQYMYTYIGGGVAVGDINQDGFVDLYFISNSSADKLYLNLGGLQFEDITVEAGITINDGFNTGVTMVDANNDGLLDIYVCRGGWKDDNNRFSNLLYINNGDLTFTERAAELGLADSNRTINAAFFDYDNDNDLDVYVSNTPDITSRAQVLDLEKVHKDPKTLETKGSDRLYNNDGTGHFTDVSTKAGLQFDIGFGLNPQVGDLNNDGLLDVYVCNDFNVPDLVYINNGNGTFTESRDKLFKHMSFNSMGSDIADINNDGLLDLMTLDMNPQDYVRSKTTMAMTSINQFELMVENGYHHQYMHNMLQMNNGNGTFSEIGNMAGIANTDWSWSVLFADFDLDGLNDIYITNGVYRDVIDRDKNNEILQILRANGRKPTHVDFLKFAKMLPQQKLNNYFYKNKGNLTFEDTSEIWADANPTFSNGAAYADLDNDGDLDVIVNNINDEATLLRNNVADLDKGNYLKISLSGPKNNKFGVGAIANIYLTDGTSKTRQLINTRGFLSSVSNILHFGLQIEKEIERVEIIWLDGKTQVLTNVTSNQLIKVNYDQATEVSRNKLTTTDYKTILTKVSSDYRHEDQYFNDYELQVLLPHKLSQTGPGVAMADVNNDGLEDVFLGGGKGQVSQLLVAGPNGAFKEKYISAFVLDKQYEDQSACFFDADNDGNQDLYVVSGSYEHYRNTGLLQDRLYLGNGQGQFTKTKNSLPELLSSGSVVVSSDYDKDGDIDLFIGGRVIPGKYPYAPISYLLINNNEKFIIETKNLAPELENIGMVCDAVWADINNDSSLDLVVTGEWMGIEVFINQDNKLVKSEDYEVLSNSLGWWNRLLIADVDRDGDEDIVAGNLGLNHKFHASPAEPFHIYTNDFDFNGIEDIVLAKRYDGKEVPVRGKTCMTQQLPHLAKKITTYTDFANKNLLEIVGKRIESALHYEAKEFRSGIFLNNGNNTFSFKPFTSAIQQSPINSIIFEDFDDDGFKDMVLAGNNYQPEVETTRYDAGIGSFLKGNGKGDFKYLSNLTSGFFAGKDVRNMFVVKTKEGKLLFVVNNNDKHDLFKVNNSK